jgi:hypothetical protein
VNTDPSQQREMRRARELQKKAETLRVAWLKWVGSPDNTLDEATLAAIWAIVHHVEVVPGPPRKPKKGGRR